MYVEIARRFISARTKEMIDSTTPEAWSALMARIEAMAPERIEEYSTDSASGVHVHVSRQRGTTGAYAIHELACRYGAPVVCR